MSLVPRDPFSLLGLIKNQLNARLDKSQYIVFYHLGVQFSEHGVFAEMFLVPVVEVLDVGDAVDAALGLQHVSVLWQVGGADDAHAFFLAFEMRVWEAEKQLR